MATTPTNKPIPSEDPRDLKFNAGKIDEVMTSDAHCYTDRFGVRRWTIAGFQYTAEEAIRKFGYITMDSFEDGATLTLPNQTLRYEANGEYYRWDGELPKVVSAGSTPETSGGVGLGAWVSVGDAALRSQLLSTEGATFVYNGSETVASQLDSLLTRTTNVFNVDEYGVMIETPSAQTGTQQARTQQKRARQGGYCLHRGTEHRERAVWLRPQGNARHRHLLLPFRSD